MHNGVDLNLYWGRQLLAHHTLAPCSSLTNELTLITRVRIQMSALPFTLALHCFPSAPSSPSIQLPVIGTSGVSDSVLCATLRPPHATPASP